MREDISLFFGRYFGKDYKYFWTTSTFWDYLVKRPFDYLALKLMSLSKYLLKVSRKMLRIGGKSCSWCGDKQNRNTGLHMSASKKGFRCCRSGKDCDRKPYV